MKAFVYFSREPGTSSQGDSSFFWTSLSFSLSFNDGWRTSWWEEKGSLSMVFRRDNGLDLAIADTTSGNSDRSLMKCFYVTGILLIVRAYLLLQETFPEDNWCLLGAFFTVPTLEKWRRRWEIGSWLSYLLMSSIKPTRSGSLVFWT